MNSSTLVVFPAISLISNIQPMIDSVSEENEEKISAMERLLNHCNDGRQTCVRVLTAFKISTVSKMAAIESGLQIRCIFLLLKYAPYLEP